MAIYVDIDEGPEETPLGVMRPSAGASMRAAVSGTFEENPSTLLYGYNQLRQANQRGTRIDKLTAEAKAKGLGFKLDAPDDGYTQEALDLIIQRKQDQAARLSVSERTPWSVIGTGSRGAAMLMTGVVDPLNIASAFIPVVSQARTAGLLARAGTSAGARAAARAQIGAIEGAAGALLMEPLVYGLHKQLEDDYTMADSLVNLGFGGLLGGGLHAGSGVVRDALSPGNPYARFAGLSNDQISSVMSYERSAARGAPVSTDGWSNTMLRAAGIDQAADIPPVIQRGAIDPAPVSVVQEAPFAKLYERTQSQATAQALDDMRVDLRAELLADIGGRAEPGAVLAMRAEVETLNSRLTELGSTAELKARAKDFQGQGMSRKQAEAAARKTIGDDKAAAEATRDRLSGQIESNAKASQADQDLAKIDVGEVPERFADQVKARADELMAAATVAKAVWGVELPPASLVIGMATPQTRDLAMRSALADMTVGKMPAVEAIFGMDPKTIGPRATASDVAAAAERQQGADALIVGDPAYARAADQQLKDIPKTNGVEDAQANLAEAMDSLNKFRASLEAGGIPPERLDSIMEGLASFDEVIKDAKNIGKAIESAALCGLRN